MHRSLERSGLARPTRIVSRPEVLSDVRERKPARFQGNQLLPEADDLSSEFSKVCAISSVVERLLHTQEVAGSNPASRTMLLLRPLGRGDS